MTTTRNGWDVYTSYSDSNLVNFPWVTGKVRKGDHYTVLDYIARRFNNEVEKIDVASSWGHNPRPVRGYTNVWSEHSTGTAIDLNAPRHGIGRRGTFSRAQVRRIRKIMRDCHGSARWGGEWSRPDEMHFELVGGNVKVSAMARRIKGGKVKPVGKVKPAKSKPKPKGTKANRSIQTALKTMGLYKGVIDGLNQSMQKAAVKAFQKFHGLVQDGKWEKKTQAAFTLNKKVQKALIKQGYSKQTVDGYYGDNTAANVRDFQRRTGLVQDGMAGSITLKRLGI